MTALLARLVRVGHRRLRGTADLGFGYSRDNDVDLRPAPVPDGVELHFLTGRNPRRAAA